MIVKMSVNVQAHGFPCNNPQAMINEIIPITIKTPLITTPNAPNMSAPIIIMADNVAKKNPPTIATIPEMISKAASIVTPVGLTF